MKLKNIKYYLQIIKPGIVFGNLITFSSCFIFASKGNINLNLFFFTFFSLFLIISGSCVLNNIIDISIDKNMTRTKNRALVIKKISIVYAWFYSYLLLFLGFIIMFYFVNFFSFFLSFLGFFIYIFLYSLYLKKKSIFSIFIGSISGAMPPIIGYYSACKKLDLNFLLFFIIFFLWQIPHFYIISIFRIKDYKNAKIPILPLKKDIFFTVCMISLCIFFFTIFSNLFYLYNFSLNKFFIFSTLINFFWLFFTLLAYFYKNNKIFYFSFLISIFSNFITSFFIAIHYM
ncbi:heme o synthase [Buchnera aphidicola (Ceratovacuna keduensis)]|uniref:heme o synthase n=1 Tax=Buchnera aphidicola TaxID=9 RepID=UPI0031B8A6CF